LAQRLQQAAEAGIERQQIVLDPGFGFGILYDQNYSLLAGLEGLGSLGQPLLAGPSRKGFLGRTLGRLNNGMDVPVDRRRDASLAAATAAILAGAHLVRVHDVRSTREAASIADAILAAR
jgi:dihydropteroate synthase